MKFITTLITCLLIFSFHFNIAQNFAPIGAEWHYEKRYVSDGSIDFVRLSSVKDTIIQGENCREIGYYDGFSCYPSYSKYLLSKNDTVFFFDSQFNEFQILHPTTAQVSDNWIVKIKDFNGNTDTLVVTVDSLSTMTLNGVTLDVKHVTYVNDDAQFPSYDYSKIIERLGNETYLFGWYGLAGQVCDMNFPSGLRCYQDTILGFYDTGIADSCEYTYDWGIGIEDQPKEGQISISPNPTNGIFKIKSKRSELLQIEIYTVLGELITQTSFTNSLQVDLQNQKSGFYFLKISNDKGVASFEKVLLVQ